MNVELALVKDKNNDNHYVYGKYEEVESYAKSVEGYVFQYLNHVNPSTVQANFNYVGNGHDPYQKSRGFSYELQKVIAIEKW
tara:strand:+ start:378 stop:623 length:246 start_codon:yes stop_codon:yes gene_type:complete